MCDYYLKSTTNRRVTPIFIALLTIYMILKTFFVSYLPDLPYAVIFLPIQNRFYPFIKAISDSNADSSYSILYSHVIGRH